MAFRLGQRGKEDSHFHPLPSLLKCRSLDPTAAELAELAEPGRRLAPKPAQRAPRSAAPRASAAAGAAPPHRPAPGAPGTAPRACRRRAAAAGTASRGAARAWGARRGPAASSVPVAAVAARRREVRRRRARAWAPAAAAMAEAPAQTRRRSALLHPDPRGRRGRSCSSRGHWAPPWRWGATGRRASGGRGTPQETTKTSLSRCLLGSAPQRLLRPQNRRRRALTSLATSKTRRPTKRGPSSCPSSSGCS
mmetsp:Transcript_106795/g.341052  ORF Transcript_106795/g.341052 Transcript_106795/m.341052 type:complete len:250 (+) Transcript_106795:92-841(+)